LRRETYHHVSYLEISGNVMGISIVNTSLDMHGFKNMHVCNV